MRWLLWVGGFGLLGVAAAPWLFMAMLLHTSVTPLFSYQVEVTVAMTVDGKPLRDTRTVRCDVARVSGFVDVGPSTVVRAKATPDDPVVLRPPGGGQIVIKGITGCAWTESMPATGEHELDLAGRGGSEDGRSGGRLTWFDDEPELSRAAVRYFLDGLVRRVEPRITDIGVSVVVSAAEGAATETKRGSQPQTFPRDDPRPLEVRRADRAVADFKGIKATIAPLNVRSDACSALAQPLAGRLGWIAIEENCGAHHDAAFLQLGVGSDLTRIDVGTTPLKAPRELVLHTSAVIASGAAVRYGTGKYGETGATWTERICVEESCVPVTMGWGQPSVRFYNPATRQVITVWVAPVSMREMVD